VVINVACGKTSNNSSGAPSIVYAQPGQTVKEAVDGLSPAGGTVVLGIGVWGSGYNSAEFIARPHITIQGAGIAGYNSTFTAMSGGTIVEGHLSASTGADYFTVQDLGVDAGAACIDAHNGGVATDGLSIFNNGQVVGAPRVESPRIENVSCLGYSPTASAHCMLVENVNNAYIRNIVTVMNCHGLALKGTNSTVVGVHARGHGIDSVIVKSDNYAPASKNYLSNITIEPLIAAGDTKGIIVSSLRASALPSPMSVFLMRLSGVPWHGGSTFQGAGAKVSATAVTLFNITVAYEGVSPTYEYCMQFVQHVSNVNITNLNCSNMWAGIAPYLPASGGFRDFTMTNLQFTTSPPMASKPMANYGQWSISNTGFGSIAGDGIVADSGVTTVSGVHSPTLEGAICTRPGVALPFRSPEVRIVLPRGIVSIRSVAESFDSYGSSTLIADSNINLLPGA
jgi:hypothetical protein